MHRSNKWTIKRDSICYYLAEMPYSWEYEAGYCHNQAVSVWDDNYNLPCCVPYSWLCLGTKYKIQQQQGLRRRLTIHLCPTGITSEYNMIAVTLPTTLPVWCSSTYCHSLKVAAFHQLVFDHESKAAVVNLSEYNCLLFWCSKEHFEMTLSLVPSCMGELSCKHICYRSQIIKSLFTCLLHPTEQDYGI